LKLYLKVESWETKNRREVLRSKGMVHCHPFLEIIETNDLIIGYTRVFTMTDRRETRAKVRVDLYVCHEDITRWFSVLDSGLADLAHS
jgi:hypothetical protein